MIEKMRTEQETHLHPRTDNLSSTDRTLGLCLQIGHRECQLIHIGKRPTKPFGSRSAVLEAGGGRFRRLMTTEET